MSHFRVEVYEGCSLTLSRVFDSRDAAEQYRNSHPFLETMIVSVDESGAAVETI